METDRLNATAPRMLEVLNRIAGEVTDHCRPTSTDSFLPDDIVKELHAVIAEATGKQFPPP